MPGKKGMDIDALRSMFADGRVWVELAAVEKVAIASDMSVVRVQVKLIPEGTSIIARMSWEFVGEDAGLYSMPTPGDLVLVAYDQGDVETAYVIRRLSTKEDKIPLRAKTMDVLRSVPGRKLSISSDTMVLIGSGGIAEETEPLVLGLVLKEALGKIYDKISDTLDKIITGPVGVDSIGGTVITNPGLVTNLTTIKAALTADKAQYISTAATDIVSQIAFTERGT